VSSSVHIIRVYYTPGILHTTTINDDELIIRFFFPFEIQCTTIIFICCSGGKELLLRHFLTLNKTQKNATSRGYVQHVQTYKQTKFYPSNQIKKNGKDLCSKIKQDIPSKITSWWRRGFGPEVQATQRG
ncbi:MAG: hypothetical protein ACI90V_008489, partial [Bacillariaceae sp.]|jgi:hypothetical protein